MKLHGLSSVTALYEALVSVAGALNANLVKVGGTAIAIGAAAKAAAIPVTMATDQPAQKVIKDGHYETVAASQTDQAMGATGAAGDFLDKLVIVPATTSPGAVAIKDGAGSAITVFTGGATSVADLSPIVLDLGLTSGSGAWKITTGASVSAIGIGKFT